MTKIAEVSEALRSLMGRVMMKMPKVVLELPKRTAILDFDRPDAARTKVRGLFWLTLATVVLGLVVVLASLWKIASTPSVPTATPSVPVMVTSATPAPPLVACDAPSPESPAPPPVQLPAEPTTPTTPSGSPDLEQYR
ncbi:MAG: hypothetical protein U0270_04975 [Labilithrix sp.]